MVDLAKTQAEWDPFFRQFGHLVAAEERIDQSRRLFVKSKVEVIEEWEAGDVLSSWTFNPKNITVGTDCDEDGFVYGKLLANDPDSTTTKIQLFNDSGRTTKVAEGTIADGSVPGEASLSAESGFTIAPTVTVNSVPGSDDNDWRLRLDISFLDRVSEVWPADSSDGDDRQRQEEASDEVKSGLRSAARRLERSKDHIVSAFERMGVAYWKEFLQSESTEMLNLEVSVDASGAVSASRTGLLADLSDRMEDDTTAAQTILQNTTSSTGPNADGDNDGDSTISGFNVKRYARSGFYRILCTDDTIGANRFTVTVRVSETNQTIEAEQLATIDQSWVSPELGLEFTISHKIDETGDTNGDLSGWSLTGITASNSDSGTFYVDLTNPSGTTHKVEVFSDSNRDTSDLVAAGSVDGTGTITLSERGGSGLSGSVSLDSFTAENTGNISLDTNQHSLDDQYTGTLTNDEDAAFDTFLARNFPGIELPGSGSPTVDDSFGSVGTRPVVGD